MRSSELKTRLFFLEFWKFYAALVFRGEIENDEWRFLDLKSFNFAIFETLGLRFDHSWNIKVATLRFWEAKRCVTIRSFLESTILRT